MVNYSAAALDATFGALADPVRRGMLARLARGESSLSELGAPFDISLPAVLKHVRVLERAGLVSAEKRGRVRRCRLQARPMRRASAWLDHYREFWEARLEALERHLLAKPQARNLPKRETQTWLSRNRNAKTRSSFGRCSPRRARRSSPRGSTPRA